MPFRSPRFRVPFLLIFLAVFFLAAWALALEALRGPAFTDPSARQEMPAGWEGQPIKYEPEIGRADIALSLDQHLYPLFAEYIEKYAKREKIKVSVGEGTCGITAGKLVRKSIDIGGFCCPPGETDRLPGLRFHTVGIMPIALITHPGNTVEEITLGEARDLFAGKIYRWSELKDARGRAGPNVKVSAIGRLHCKLRPGHWRLLLDNEDLFSPNLTEVGTIPDMISLVSRIPGAVGYEVLFMIERYRSKGAVKVLKLDGVAPDNSSLASGRYPLYRTLNLTTWEGGGLENEKARKLVRHILKEAEGLHGRYGFVPASALKRAGWKFNGDELIGEPR